MTPERTPTPKSGPGVAFLGFGAAKQAGNRGGHEKHRQARQQFQQVDAHVHEDDDAKRQAYGAAY